MLVNTCLRRYGHVFHQVTNYQMWEVMELEVGGKKKGPSDLWKECVKNHLEQIGLK